MNIVAHNLTAMNAMRQYNLTMDSRKKSTEKLSSGYRVNRAADDAAGLAISEKMRTQIRGLNRGSTNIQDGISLVQVADGAMSTIHDLLHRMNELATQAANDTNTDVDRDAIQKELGMLSSEIDRIGRDTTFNTMHILDDAQGLEADGKITKMISCPSADNGYFSEPITIMDGGVIKYSPGATLDFSKVNEKNIGLLDGHEFSFNCSINCKEQFHVIFNTKGGEKAENLATGRPHYYTVDISKCKTGAEVCDAIFDLVKRKPPGGGVSTSGDALSVSHSNLLRKTADGKLEIFATKSFDTPEAALNYAENQSKNLNRACGVYCSDLTKIVYPELVNEFNVQCSSNAQDNEMIKTRRINAGVLKVSDIDASTYELAGRAMGRVQGAIDFVSDFRSELGAYQNRLEHSYNNVRNTEENTQAAESRIRDTDMAKEMVQLSMANIVAEAGQSMLAQANQSTQGVLSLLS